MPRPKICYRLEPVQEANKTQMYIYDDVSAEGPFNWNTWEYDESETSAKYFRDQLKKIPEGNEIELHINSNGGEVKEGVAIYNILSSSGRKITGIVDGVAHSVAFLILQACDTRKMCLGTTALIHDMWMYCAGNARQLRKYADDLDDMMESNIQVFMQRAKITEEQLRDMMANETYLTPEKALEYGLIDEVAGKRKQESQEELLQKLRQMQMEMNEAKSFRENLAILAKEQKPKPKQEEKPKPNKPTMADFFKKHGGN